MAGLKNIKLKIQSVGKTRKVTRAMEAVSAVKMRKAQERALNARPYAAAALSILERISHGTDIKAHSLMQARPGKTAVVIVTSDKGLAGALNSAAIKQAERAISDRRLTPASAVLFCIGRRGADYFATRGFDVRERRENVSDAVSEADMRTVTDAILALREVGEVGDAVVIYTNFLSTFEQRPVVRQILPVTSNTIRDMVEGIAPVKGKFARVHIPMIGSSVAYTIEPSSREILDAVMPKILGVAIFHALLEAKASEHSARMVAMKNATDKARDVSKELTLKYNKARQAAITREVSEITSGIEAMR
ncbi:MAG: ATP synthase F1 subunit gamma [Patescibacteria group bacterium]